MKPFGSLLAAILLLVSVTARAQEKIESDRSDEGESANTIGSGHTQAEVGVYCVDYRLGASSIISDLSLRYGLLGNLDLIAIVQEGRERVRFMSETSQGFFPLALGAKLSLLEEKGVLPAVSLSAYVQLPLTARTGEEAVHWSKAFNIIAEKQLFNNKWDLLINAGLQQPSNARNYQAQIVEVVNYELFEKLTLMAEHFATYDHGERPQNNIGVGLSYFLTENIQLDVSGASTIGSEQANRTLSTGIAVRF